MTDRRIAVLLGAGASAEAGVPMSFEMTRAIVDGVNKRGSSKSISQTLNFVCGALVAYDAAGGGDPYEGLDVERVFAAIELLSRRRNLEVTPFVSSWHPAVDAWDRPDLPNFWDSGFQKALLEEWGGPNAARDKVAELIRKVTDGGSGGVYRLLMGEMINELVGRLQTEDTSYLAPLLRAGKRDGGLTVATLNYDLSIERAGRAEGVDVTTGIENWASVGVWAWPISGVRLLKLHGSVDWAWEESGREPGQMAYRTVTRQEPLTTDVVGRRQPVLVFGHGAKLRPDGPFLSLLSEFETLLAGVQSVVIVGYSLRDDHVNEIIRRWLVEDQSRDLVVIDPFFPKVPYADGSSFRGELVETLDPAYWMNHTFRGRLSVMRTPAGPGLAKYFGNA